jgi:hypothetical protein
MTKAGGLLYLFSYFHIRWSCWNLWDEACKIFFSIDPAAVVELASF